MIEERDQLNESVDTKKLCLASKLSKLNVFGVIGSWRMPNLVGAKPSQYAKKHVTITVNEDSTRLISNHLHM